MDRIFISVCDAAALLNVTERCIQSRIQRKKYEFKLIPGKSRGGIQYLIALDSLPQDAQERYYKQSEKPAPINIFSEEALKKYTDDQRNEAIRKYNILLELERTDLSIKDFITKFNSEHTEKISYRKLEYWAMKCNSQGITGLIDQRKCLNEGNDCVPEEAWEIFYSLYMAPQKRSVRLCYDKTKAYFEREYPEIKFPSYQTFTRKVREEIPEYAKAVFRGGKKLLNDHLPYMERDTSDLTSNACWVSDHHLADVFVKTSRGKIIRPWITAFQDAKSRKIVSVLVRESSPNATAIKQALRIGVSEYGIPEEIYTDNGKDYLSSELDPDSENSVLNILGIRKRRAKPYHGQSKPIERFFGTLENRFGKLFYSYVGSDGKERPEHMQKLKKQLEKDNNIPSIVDYTKKLNDYITEYNSTPHSGYGMEGQTPDEVYYKSFQGLPKMIENPDILKIIFGNSEIRKVNNAGVKVCGINFTSEELMELFNKSVLVKYDPNDLTKVFIFTTEGRFICQAIAKVRSPFRSATEEDFKEAAKQRKKVDKLIRENAPKRRKDEADILFENIAEEYRYKLEHEDFENEFTAEAEKAVSDMEQEEKFNPYAEMCDLYRKKGVI